PAPPTVTPLGREDDEIERMGDLHLEPARSPPAGLVRRRERLHHHALVTARERLVEERLRDIGVARLYPRDDEFRRKAGLEGAEPRPGRRVEEIVAVEVQAVEEVRRERRLLPKLLGGGLRPEPAHRDLEGTRASVGPQRDRLAVEDDRRHVDRAEGRDDL